MVMPIAPNRLRASSRSLFVTLVESACTCPSDFVVVPLTQVLYGRFALQACGVGTWRLPLERWRILRMRFIEH